MERPAGKFLFITISLMDADNVTIFGIVWRRQLAKVKLFWFLCLKYSA
jgi:hypothetical protein